MANTTVIIAKSGESLDSRDDWWYSVEVRRFTYKSSADRYGVEILARKKDANFQTTDEICIWQYNRAHTTHTIETAHRTLLDLIQAIRDREPVWDARNYETER